MKDFRILALAAMLALGFTLSAQAQTENTTGVDQYTTQSTDQAASAPASPYNSSMFAQQGQGTASTTNMSNETDSDRDSQHVNIERDLNRKEQERDRDIRNMEIENDSGAN